MAHIDVIVTRHEKKDKDITPSDPGNDVDREKVHLSNEGIEDARKLGQRELQGPYDFVYVATSNFLRTRQTANAILEGAGFSNVEMEIYGDSRRARLVTDEKLGLGGTQWENNPGVPKFGYAQHELNASVNALLKKYFLERTSDPVTGAEWPSDNPDRWPVMARRGAALFHRLADGLEEVASVVKPGSKGLVLVVTHAPTIDALATVYTGSLTFAETGDRDPVSDKMVYDVRLDGPIDAHNQGQYMRGSVQADGLGDFHVPLVIKGKEAVMRVGKMRNMASQMRHASYHGVQR